MAEQIPQGPHAATDGPEPWLGGHHADLPAIPRLLCCSLDQSLADLRRWTALVDQAGLWKLYKYIGSLGFQLRHLAGSVDRLLTYARGEQLTESQIAAMRAEAEPGAELSELLTRIEQSFERAKAFAHAPEAARGDEPRYIGRKRLETTLGVLLGHIAEHTQRHTGQAIIIAKLASKTALQEPRPE